MNHSLKVKKERGDLAAANVILAVLMPLATPSPNITSPKVTPTIGPWNVMSAEFMLAGLTTGAVTGIIDRLEEAGYVRRVNDPKDRRRSIVAPTRNKKLERKIEAIFMPLHERMHKLMSSYSDSELALLLDILTKSLDQSHQELMKLRGLQRHSPVK